MITEFAIVILVIMEDELRPSTMRDILEERMKDRENVKWHMRRQLESGETSVRHLISMAEICNVNALFLYDTTNIFAHDIIDEWEAMRRGKETWVPKYDNERQRRKQTNAFSRMRVCLDQFRHSMAAYIHGGKDWFDDVADLYYEACMKDIALMEINLKQLLDKMRTPNSKYVARLELMRLMSMLAIGLVWSTRDICEAVYVRDLNTKLPREQSMFGMQHWIVELQSIHQVPMVKADANVEACFDKFCKSVDTGVLMINCCTIVADERGWDKIPAWYPIRQAPVDNVREDMRYHTRADIEK